jgi:hypothetical protein
LNDRSEGMKDEKAEEVILYDEMNKKQGGM